MKVFDEAGCSCSSDKVSCLRPWHEIFRDCTERWRAPSIHRIRPHASALLYQGITPSEAYCCTISRGRSTVSGTVPTKLREDSMYRWEVIRNTSRRLEDPVTSSIPWLFLLPRLRSQQQAPHLRSLVWRTCYRNNVITSQLSVPEDAVCTAEPPFLVRCRLLRLVALSPVTSASPATSVSPRTWTSPASLLASTDQRPIGLGRFRTSPTSSSSEVAVARSLLLRLSVGCHAIDGVVAALVLLRLVELAVLGTIDEVTRETYCYPDKKTKPSKSM